MLLMTAALPMTMFLSASLSQDALCIGLSALLSSLLIRTIVDGPSIRRLAVSAVIVTVLGCARPPYAAFLLPLFTVHGAATHWRKLPSLIVVALASTSIILAYGGYIATFAGPNLSNGAEPAAQLRAVAADPLLFFRALLAATKVNGVGWLAGIIGYFRHPLPIPVYIVYSIAMVGTAVIQVSVLHCAAPPHLIDARSAVLVAGAGAISLVASVLLIALLLFLTWTSVGGAVLLGIQGRYFIEPALVALPLILSPLLLRARRPSLSELAHDGTAGLLALQPMSGAFFAALLVWQYWAW
jgi:uncharacterized membrane protein